MGQSENSTAEKIRKIIETTDTASALTLPVIDSINNLLTLTANSLGSEEASIITRDGDDGDLKFTAAIGQVADQMIGMKIPAGKGIAGFVMSSGQPMAIADVGQEESFYAEVDKQTGYTTQTILATPLRLKGEVIGVLEYVNRTGAPPYQSFTPEEMDKAAIYAEAIAALVGICETSQVLLGFCRKTLAVESEDERAEIEEWLQAKRAAAEHREMLDLALLVREVSTRGAAERRLCREVLEAFARYSENGETGFLSF